MAKFSKVGGRSKSAAVCGGADFSGTALKTAYTIPQRLHKDGVGELVKINKRLQDIHIEIISTTHTIQCIRYWLVQQLSTICTILSNK